MDGGTVESRLILKLRQVNGNGVLSGVSIGMYSYSRAAVVSIFTLTRFPGPRLLSHRGIIRTDMKEILLSSLIAAM